MLAVGDVVDIAVTGLHEKGDDLVGELALTRRSGHEPVTAQRLGRSVLLEANVLWAGTGGATLGVIPDDRSVVLAYQEKAAAIDGQRFENLLSGLADAAEFWKKLIEDGSQDAPEPSAGTLPMYHLRA